ncbi:hypothetical protein M409DRAFT_66108 [Zasmidium cellare ATCC 36951]|uniref:Major facilitator superfamily (MFS) profile domain-containing protein n=1 Tax=Zasmidium cellare ATCC 36951 TaxID=1080233 RepID=A0A6A6CK65_ZASCE|nr:uncharacterized protein M409DRAFT_66108 [Zasmidium cellare ATCC 36951]KAF2166993.1 hypothetical protein M409DRAFT_66108 [Zasmidium cellare ATCC 36951]
MILLLHDSSGDSILRSILRGLTGTDPVFPNIIYQQCRSSRSGDHEITEQALPDHGTNSYKLKDLPPEEGVQGWICVGGGFLALFCSFGFLNAMGVFQTYYQENTLHEYAPSDIAWIFSFQLMSMWAPGPLFGRIIDTYGPRLVLLPCSILCVFALCMTSLASDYYQIFLAQGVAFGIGAGGVFTSSTVCVSQWFLRRRGLANGIITVGSSLAGVILPLFIYKLLVEIGLAGALRYSALMIGVLLALSCFLVRPRMPPKKWDKKAGWFDPSLFRQPPFALFTIGSFLSMWGTWIPFAFISTFATQKAFSSEMALSLISLINATSIIGRLLPNYLSDKVGHFNVISVAGFLSSMIMACLWLPFNFFSSHAGITVFCLCYGFTSGTFIALIVPCAAKTGSIETIGTRFGTYQPVIGMSMLTGLPISGAILDLQGGLNYWGLQTFAIVTTFIGAIIIAASTVLFRRSSNTWRV